MPKEPRAAAAASMLPTLATLAAIFPAGAAVIERDADGGWRARGGTYRAVVDGSGGLRSLTIGGVEFLGERRHKGRLRTGGAFPGDAPAEAVELRGSAVTARRGAVRVTYTFGATGIDVETEGAALEFFLSDAVTALVRADGDAAPGDTGGTPDVRTVVAGGAAFGLGQPFHCMYRRLVPSILCGRGGKPEAPFTNRIECGVPVDPLDLLAIVSLEAFGAKTPPAPAFRVGERPKVALALRNLGASAAKADVRFRVLDHHTNGTTVHEETVGAAVPAGGTGSASVDVPLKEPGLYWIRAEVMRGGAPVKGTRLGVIYDAERYRPPLTRPPDFKEFWGGKLREMRAVPFDAEFTERPDLGNERFAHHELRVSGRDGRRITTFLRLPRGAGPHDAEVISHWGSNSPERVLAELAKLEKQPRGAGMWQRGADRIRVGAPQPEDSRYTRWNGRDDNNCLDSYLMNVRMADYLRSRGDVRGIWLFGGSRSGASMLAAAALAPEGVVAVNAHVPTCCGLSWDAKPYAGWGRPPDRTPEGLRIAAYFDPVNFAPDLKVPLVVDGGFYDGLAPAPGILAFHNRADRAPFRRCAIELGGHGYFAPDSRRRMERELAEHLERARSAEH